MVDLKQTLGRFLAIPGVRQAFLVGRDGLMIEGMTRDGKEDIEAVGALTSTSISTAEAIGQEISRGSVIGIILEYEQGLVSVDDRYGERGQTQRGRRWRHRSQRDRGFGSRRPPRRNDESRYSRKRENIQYAVTLCVHRFLR